MPKILYGDYARLFHLRTIFLQQKNGIKTAITMGDTLCGLKINAEFS